MDLRRSRISQFLLLVCCLVAAEVKAQYGENPYGMDSIVSSDTLPEYTTEAETTTSSYTETPAETPVVADTLQQAYERSNTERNHLSRKDWERISGGLHYEEDSITPKKKDKTQAAPSKGFNWGAGMGPLQIVAMVVAIAIIILLLYKLLPGVFSGNNIKVRNMKEVLLEDLDEEDIKNLDLDALLQQALASADYRMAFRVRYIRTIKQLWQHELISYKKDKTNFEYLMQLSGTAFYTIFRELTLSFDGIWYGEMTIDEPLYSRMVPLFEQINTQIKESERGHRE